MSLVLALVLLAQGPELDAKARATEAAPSATTRTAPRSGLYGLGLGFELPMVGILTGTGSSSEVGWGFNLGLSVSWEITPAWVGRVYFGGGNATGGRARISYLEADTVLRAEQDADLFNLELGVGGAYQFRFGSPFVPYIGADFGWRLNGYSVDFEGELEDLQTRSLLNNDSGTATEAITPGWAASLRGGLRIELTNWLSTLTEVRATYVMLSEEPVTNTLPRREVRLDSDSMFLFRTTFSLRIGL